MPTRHWVEVLNDPLTPQPFREAIAEAALSNEQVRAALEAWLSSESYIECDACAVLDAMLPDGFLGHPRAGHG